MRYVTASDPGRPRHHRAPGPPWTALVLAGDRRRPDPVASAAGTDCKVMAPVGGRPMMERVIDALGTSDAIEQRLACGPPRWMLETSPVLARNLEDGQLGWLPEQPSPAASALASLDALSEPYPLLVTTGDNALLTSRVIDDFTGAAREQGWDAAIGVVPHRLITACYPQARPTATRLADGAVCGCNLFALLSPASRCLVAHWRRLEQHRKRPLRTVAGAVGLRSLAAYGVGRLDLETALRRLSQRMGLTVGAVVLPHASAGLDVDTVADWRLVEAVVNETG